MNKNRKNIIKNIRANIDYSPREVIKVISKLTTSVFNCYYYRLLLLRVFAMCICILFT